MNCTEGCNLLMSVKRGHYDCFKLLIEDGKSLQEVNAGLLLTEVLNHNYSYYFLKLLIEKKIDVNVVFGRSTVLHRAVIHNVEREVILLIEAGANVNALDSCGETPLSRSMLCGQIRIFLLLLQAGADPNISEVLSYAVEKDSPFYVEKLIEHGANIYLKNSEGVSAYDICVRENKFFAVDYFNIVNALKEPCGE